MHQKYKKMFMFKKLIKLNLFMIRKMIKLKSIHLKYLIILHQIPKKSNLFKKHLPSRLPINIKNINIKHIIIMKDVMMSKEEQSKIIIKGVQSKIIIRRIGIDKIMYKKGVNGPLNKDINKNHKIETEIVYKNSKKTIVSDKQTITDHQKIKTTNVNLGSVPVHDKNNQRTHCITNL